MWKNYLSCYETDILVKAMKAIENFQGQEQYEKDKLATSS